MSVLEPGEAIGLYHAEPQAQEDFLVVAGEHGGIVYPVSAVAAGRGVSVAAETRDASEAYRPHGFPRRVRYGGWFAD